MRLKNGSESRRCAKPIGRCVQAGESAVDRVAKNRENLNVKNNLKRFFNHLEVTRHKLGN